jgi:hypothetical protein
VQVGTEVVIVQGGGGVHEPAAVTPPAQGRGGDQPPPRDPVIVALEAEDTPVLLDQMRTAMDEDPRGAVRPRWTDLASVLVLRGTLDEDDEALRGLFSAAGGLQPGRLRDEYATFLEDAFVQAPIRLMGALGREDGATRQSIAALLAGTALALFPGEAGDRQLQWPTRRVPREALGGYGRRAWDAVAEAESRLRPAELAAGR